MTIPVRITIRHMAHSPLLTQRIRLQADKLSEVCPRIVSCQVVVEQRDLHKQQGHTFNVRLVVHAPGQEIVATHDHDEEPYVAVRDAFESALRQLDDYARQLRREVKAHSLPRR
jgi:ribosome-associated translation inhibitor RaiA